MDYLDWQSLGQPYGDRLSFSYTPLNRPSCPFQHRRDDAAVGSAGGTDLMHEQEFFHHGIRASVANRTGSMVSRCDQRDNGTMRAETKELIVPVSFCQAKRNRNCKAKRRSCSTVTGPVFRWETTSGRKSERASVGSTCAPGRRCRFSSVT